jgi:hypothetical protein
MPSRPRFDADAVRVLVRERVEATTMRAVADEIGISRGGLESFLDGGRPYSRTRLALAAWQLRQGHPNGTVTREEMDAAMAIFERFVEAGGTPAIRAKRVREVTERLTGRVWRGAAPGPRDGPMIVA